MFTLCSLVYNNSDYLFFQEKIARKLAKYDFQRLLIDSSENDYERKRLESLPDTKIVDGAWINKYSGSQAHGVAVNEMVNHIDTEYAIIVDLDIVPLVPAWDEILLKYLNDGVDAIGVPYNPLHGRRRIQKMPTVFFFAFNVQKIRKAKLEWRTLPTPIRLKIYRFYRKFNKYILKRESCPKFFDFEMSQFALLQMKMKRLKTIAFEMVQPWEDAACLKFDISELPVDKKKVDPLEDSYPEEWHFEGVPFVTHQRRSYAKSFNQTDYSRGWVRVVKNYLSESYNLIV